LRIAAGLGKGDHANAGADVHFVMTLSGGDTTFVVKEMLMPTTRTEKLDLRLTPDAKRTLQAAAKAAHRSVSEFVLECALARAEETLADRRQFGLDASGWAAFMAALDAPPRALPRLERLVREPSVFEHPRRR
jgi:uncharacterized protein (DUF1778 family)